MERDFWLSRWQEGRLGWHREDINPLIVEHWKSLGLAAESRVFLPLCGKTLDMGYLASLGHRVLGCELSGKAVQEFFAEADMPYQTREESEFMRHVGNGITILQGDVFDLDADLLSGVVGVFDRGALIALPPTMRKDYVAHLTAVLPEGARILLVTLEYDQALTDGPPFSVPEREIRDLYAGRFLMTNLVDEETSEIPPRFAEAGCGGSGSPVRQAVWKLTPR